jgi:hypothetical protein
VGLAQKLENLLKTFDLIFWRHRPLRGTTVFRAARRSPST